MKKLPAVYAANRITALCDGLMFEVAKALDEFEVNQKFLLTPTLALSLRKN